jgi:serine/threonine protein kinase
VDGRSLAEKPNLVSLLRCRWGKGRRLAAPFVLRAATDVASALEYMHARGICHGDVYAHNVLAAEDGTAVLCDYGAFVQGSNQSRD